MVVVVQVPSPATVIVPPRAVAPFNVISDPAIPVPFIVNGFDLFE